MSERLSIAIIDYDMGNVKSIENAFNRIGDFNVEVTNSHSVILSADIIILPGVGAFPDAMRKLKSRNLIDILDEVVIANRVPTLGICLGMQLLFEQSEEKGTTRGLGWILGKLFILSPQMKFEFRISVGTR